jgi:hypothetical protein
VSLAVFDDRETARRHALFHGGDEHRMDGSGLRRTSVITGLDKLSRLQQRPFSHLYSAFARDASLCNVIYVIGYGLADFHLNKWLHEARLRNPRPSILFVDLWRDGFAAHIREVSPKPLRMFHSLRIEINDPREAYSPAPGWTVSNDRTAAVWDRGFQAFLNSPGTLMRVLEELRVRP